MNDDYEKGVIEESNSNKEDPMNITNECKLTMIIKRE
jgi:hypothetical protein